MQFLFNRRRVNRLIREYKKKIRSFTPDKIFNLMEAKITSQIMSDSQTRDCGIDVDKHEAADTVSKSYITRRDDVTQR